MVLVSKAFPHLQEEAQERLAISKYMEQLWDPQILFGVKQRWPSKLCEAVAATIELEWATRKQAVYPRSLNQNIVTIHSIQQDLVGVVKKLVERVEQLKLGP